MCTIHTPNKPVQGQVNKVVSTLSVMPYPVKDFPLIASQVSAMAANWNWHTRNEMTIFLNNFMFSSIFELRSTPGAVEGLLATLQKLLADEKIEVRDSARRTLTNVIAWEVLDEEAKKALFEHFKRTYQATDAVAEASKKHAAALGMCAFVLAKPRQMPSFLADAVLFLCKCLTDSSPSIQVHFANF